LGGPFIYPNDYHQRPSIADALDMLTGKSESRLTISPMEAVETLKFFSKKGVQYHGQDVDFPEIGKYNRALFLVNGLGGKSHLPDPKPKSRKITKAITIFAELARGNLEREWARRAAVNCAILSLRREGREGIKQQGILNLLAQADKHGDPVAAYNLWLLQDHTVDNQSRLWRSAKAGFAPALMALARQNPDERLESCRRAAQIGYLPAKFSYLQSSRITRKQFETVAEPCFVSDPICVDLLHAQLEDQNLDPAQCLPPRQPVAFDITGKTPLSEKQPSEGKPSYELLRRIAKAIATYHKQHPHGRLNPNTIYWSNDEILFCPADDRSDTRFGFYADNDVANGCEPTTGSDVFSFAILANGLLFRRELLTGPGKWGSLPVFGFASIGGRPIIPKNLGAAIRSIIRCCWASDPTHRPPMSKVVTALPTDWLDLKPASVPKRPGPLMRGIVAADVVPFLDAWSQYGTCRRAKGPKGERLFVVCHPAGPKQPGNAEWEAYFHPFLDARHPCLMPIAGYSQTGRESPEGLMVACELEPDATLAQLMGKTMPTEQANHSMTETQICVIVLGLVCGLRQLHSLGLAHLSLSPGNIFVNGRDQVRIGSYFSGSMGANEWIAKPEKTRRSIYTAPELRDGLEVKDPKKADIFALSFIIYELLTGFRIEGTTGAQDQRPVIRLDMNRVVSGLLRRGWSTNPDVRPTIEEYFNELNKIQFHIFLDIDAIELGYRFDEWAELRKPGPMAPPNPAADQGRPPAKPPAKPAAAPRGKSGR
jgi:hypothetical protein